MSFLVLNDKLLRKPDIKSLIPSEPCETNNNRFGKDLRIDWCFGVHPGVLLHSWAEILPRDTNTPETRNPIAPLPRPASARRTHQRLLSGGNWLRGLGLCRRRAPLASHLEEGSAVCSECHTLLGIINGDDQIADTWGTALARPGQGLNLRWLVVSRAAIDSLLYIAKHRFYNPFIAERCMGKIRKLPSGNAWCV